MCLHIYTRTFTSLSKCLHLLLATAVLLHVTEGAQHVLLDRVVVKVGEAVLLAELADNRGEVNVVAVVHSRKEVMLDLEVQPTVDLTPPPPTKVAARLGLAGDEILSVTRADLLRTVEVVRDEKEVSQVEAAEHVLQHAARYCVADAAGVQAVA